MGTAAEFGVEIGKYRGVVGVPRRVFQRLLSERCVEAYYLQPTRFESIAERKLRRLCEAFQQLRVKNRGSERLRQREIAYQAPEKSASKVNV